MPRRTNWFATLEAQGQRVLKLLEAEIHDLEARLGELRDQAARWSDAIGLSGGRATRWARPAPRRAGRGRSPQGRVRAKKPASPPVDWDAVLARLPKRFSKADLDKATPKLKNYPQARVIAVARWSRSNQIRKVGEGQYQKTT